MVCTALRVVARTCSGWCLVLASWLSIPEVRGADSDAPPDAEQTDVIQYRESYRHYTTRDGLPQNSITALLESSDGYLWLGTYGGLTRFDGLRFTVFHGTASEGPGSDRILSLLEDRPGRLWIGTENAGLTVLRHGKFERLDLCGGRCRVGALIHAPPRILAVTDIGVFEVQSETARSRALPSPPGLRLAAALPGGPIYLSGERGLFQLEGETVTSIPLPEGIGQILSLHGAEGTVWVGTSREIHSLHKGTWSRQFAQHTNLGATLLAQDANGSWWLHDDDYGVVRMDVAGTPLPLAPEVQQMGRLEQALLDRSGNLWLGSNGRGLMRIRAATIAVVDDASAGFDLPAMPILGDGAGGQWLGLLCGGIRHRSANGRVSTVPWFSSSAACPWSMARTADELWVGTADGWLARAESPDFAVLKKIRQLPEQPIVRAIVPAPQGGWWIALNGRLVWLRQDGLGEPRPVPALEGMTISRIKPALAGGHWFVGDQGALRIVNEAVAERVTETDGLSSRFARDLLELNDHTLWIGTYGGGVNVRRAGVLKSYRESDGLFDNTVSCFLQDGTGRVWTSGNRGISLFSADQVARAGIDSNLYTTGYAQSEGLRHAETNGGTNNACHQDEQGRLWFPLVSGFAVVMPEQAVQSLRQAARPVIEHLVIAGQAQALDEPLDLSTNVRDVEIRFSAPNLSNSESIRFRVRLSEHEPWTELGEQRSVFYPLLPYGDLTFQVSARVADGAWLDMSQPLRIRHRSPWYWHPLAISSALIVGVGLVLVGRKIVVEWLDARARRMAQNALRHAENLAIDNRRLHEQANLDSLTGLANRRRFTDSLDEIWRQSSLAPITLMIIDVDEFKRYNDTFGHPAGDACLQAIARAMLTTARSPTLLARYGGEEFAVISVNCDRAAAGKLAERLRSSVAALALDHAPGATHAVVTISIGVHTFLPGPENSPNQMIIKADEALYQAKSAGRNQVVAGG